MVKAQFVAALNVVQLRCCSRDRQEPCRKIQTDLLAPHSGRTKAENLWRDFKRPTAAALQSEIKFKYSYTGCGLEDLAQVNKTLEVTLTIRVLSSRVLI